eukprot:CAMPEP_0173187656 /NCGR_PEP_ID=MMETSP1141-20130122/10829_1 /TAXON_ID=483371 /ORGANISM="non described non described, Strain CCMP2298" /LENGTH=145 /DNA_ID=CAMNT_0014111515 /DNA_START=1608 /DNA_END=2045 /DNA_ORIENTATION=+
MAVAIPMDDDLADLSVLSKVLWPTHRVLGGQCRGHADYVHQISLNDAVIVQVPAVQETRHHFRPRRQGRNFLFLLLLLLALPVLLYNFLSVHGREGVRVFVVRRPASGAEPVQVFPDMMPAPHAHLVSARTWEEILVRKVQFLHA